MTFWDVIIAASALMLVFEGIMPFVAPAKWKQTMRQAIDLSDGQLRFIGLIAMVIGLTVLFFVK
jgi:uncharacterized protein